MNKPANRPPPARPCPGAGAGRRSGPGINPWVAVALLALAGWALDSTVTSITLQQHLGWVAHLFHPWYALPLLVGGFVVARRLLPRDVFRVPGVRVPDLLRSGLHAEERRVLALTGTSTSHRAVLTLVQQLPTTSMTAPDLARLVGRDPGEIARTLRELVGAGLVDVQVICATRFYRLTADPRRQAALAAATAWQAHWQAQVESLGLPVNAPGMGGGRPATPRQGVGGLPGGPRETVPG